MEKHLPIELVYIVNQFLHDPLESVRIELRHRFHVAAIWLNVILDEPGYVGVILSLTNRNGNARILCLSDPAWSLLLNYDFSYDIDFIHLLEHRPWSLFRDVTL